MDPLLSIASLIACGFMGIGWYLSTHRQCPSCKKLIRKHYLYCPHCGHSWGQPGWERATRSKEPDRPRRTTSLVRPRGDKRPLLDELEQPPIPVRRVRKHPHLPEKEPDLLDWTPLPPRRTFRPLQHTPISRLLLRSHCPSCHGSIHSDDMFCGQCGKKL